MKKSLYFNLLVIPALSLTVMLGLTGCSNAEGPTSATTQVPVSAAAPNLASQAQKVAAQANATAAQTNGIAGATENASATNHPAGHKVLVAYFSHSGNTKVIANYIAKATGATLFEIKAVQAYPENYNEVVEVAKKEQQQNARPQLVSQVANLAQYDTIFVGYPNWWGTMPMPVFTFLENSNLAGKTVIPFCTHEGSQMGRSEADLKRLCAQSTVLQGLPIRGSSVNSAESQVLGWLKGLNLSK